MIETARGSRRRLTSPVLGNALRHRVLHSSDGPREILYVTRDPSSPRVINVDRHPAYPSAITGLTQSGELGPRCRCRRSPYMNNIIEQDHRFIKKRITASLGFRSAEGAWRTIEGYEAMHAIRKGQIRWLDRGDVVGQRQFIHALFGIAA